MIAVIERTVQIDIFTAKPRDIHLPDHILSAGRVLYIILRVFGKIVINMAALRIGVLILLQRCIKQKLGKRTRHEVIQADAYIAVDNDGQILVLADLIDLLRKTVGKRTA